MAKLRLAAAQVIGKMEEADHTSYVRNITPLISKYPAEAHFLLGVFFLKDTPYKNIKKSYHHMLEASRLQHKTANLFTRKGKGYLDTERMESFPHNSCNMMSTTLDPWAAINKCAKQIKEGDSKAYVVLAYYYQQLGDNKERFLWLERATDLKDLGARHQIALAKIAGEHYPRDIERGIEILSELAAEKYAPSLLILAHFNYWGVYKIQDHSRAIELAQQAAELGFVDAMNFLAMYYDIKGDKEKSLLYIQKAADNFDEDAMLIVAEQLKDDDPKKKVYLRKSANLGNVAAQRRLAISSLGKNDDMFLHWATIAATNNDSRANLMLGNFYAKRENYKNKEKSYQYYKKAAALGNNEALTILTTTLKDRYFNDISKNVQLTITNSDGSTENMSLQDIK